MYLRKAYKTILRTNRYRYSGQISSLQLQWLQQKLELNRVEIAYKAQPWLKQMVRKTLKQSHLHSLNDKQIARNFLRQPRWPRTTFLQNYNLLKWHQLANYFAQIIRLKVEAPPILTARSKITITNLQRMLNKCREGRPRALIIIISLASSQLRQKDLIQLSIMRTRE